MIFRRVLQEVVGGLDEIVALREREVAERPHLHAWEGAAARILAHVAAAAPARLAFPISGLVTTGASQTWVDRAANRPAFSSATWMGCARVPEAVN